MAQVVNLAFQVPDAIEDFDEGFVFSVTALTGEPDKRPLRSGSILGRLGFSIVALKAELLACAALGALLVASLLTTATSIAGLGET